MVKQLRWRLILAAMAAFFIVLCGIVALINIVDYYIVTDREDQILKEVADFGQFYPAYNRSETAFPYFPMIADPEYGYSIRFFTVFMGPGDRVDFSWTDYISSIGHETAADYALKAVDTGKTKGYMEGYRFLIVSIQQGKMVIFLDTELVINYMNTLLLVSLGAGVISLVIVFVLVLLLSGRALRPYLKNMEQQKRFITDASHELKTPLTSISTSTDVIALTYGEDEWIQNIRSQTERMSRLVSGLVTLSRLDEAEPIPVKENFSLSDAAWEAAEPFEAQARAVGKTLTIHIEEQLQMTGDRASIQQIISVLLSNAVRYANDGSEIRFDVFRKGGRKIIEVFNDCDYETPPDVNRLFDRFYRPDESRAAQTGGTGVGLAIAKAACEAHGGTIRAKCPDGKTITFTVTL